MWVYMKHPLNIQIPSRGLNTISNAPCTDTISNMPRRVPCRFAHLLRPKFRGLLESLPVLRHACTVAYRLLAELEVRSRFAHAVALGSNHSFDI
jgi:hypothetical protein